MAEGGRREEARRWMLQAGFDLKAADWNLEGGFFNTVCFLAQQSAEKALKSALYYSGASRTKLMTHSTVQLLAETGAFIPSAKSLMDDARELDLHYVPSRYPNGLPGGYPHSFYGEKAARTALGCVA
jgi:HEPN domain-containing protein